MSYHWILYAWLTDGKVGQNDEICRTCGIQQAGPTTPGYLSVYLWSFDYNPSAAVMLFLLKEPHRGHQYSSHGPPWEWQLNVSIFRRPAADLVCFIEDIRAESGHTIVVTDKWCLLFQVRSRDTCTIDASHPQNWIGIDKISQGHKTKICLIPIFEEIGPAIGWVSKLRLLENPSSIQALTVTRIPKATMLSHNNIESCTFLELKVSQITWSKDHDHS